LKSVRGRSFRLSNYSGKVLVVSLWATWCVPCRFETPGLVKLQKEFQSQGVQVVELSTENPEHSAAAVRRWVRRYRVPYRVGWAAPGVALTLMQGRDAIPQTYIISRTGRIVRRFVGINPVVTTDQWKLAIQEALDAKD
jgi:thiol-disulfide isomerase/thioredoxin